MLKRCGPVALLVLRLWTGLNFLFSHGLGKLGRAEQFIAGDAVQQFPLPFLSGWFAILAEVVGGALLAAGLATRAAAASLFLTMLGAGFVVHADDPWMKKEFALTYAAIALVFVAQGSGPLALDRLFRRSRKA